MARSAATVRLKGLRETQRALRKISRDAPKVVQDELKKAAEPVAGAWRADMARYPGASLSTIGPRASTKGVFVTQRKRKVTGHHPEFGKLQMRIALAALAEHQDEVVSEVEAAIDQLGGANGF